MTRGGGAHGLWSALWSGRECSVVALDSNHRYIIHEAVAGEQRCHRRVLSLCGWLDGVLMKT